MQILLKRNIPDVGRVGDVVKVKAGFARNFLLPRGYAALVSSANLVEIERLRASAQLEENERVQHLRELAKTMADLSVTIEGRANQDGHLFGSVNAAQIAAALRAKGFEIQDGQVRLEAPLKEIGVFDIRLHLHQEIEPTVKVWVVQAKPN